MDILYFVGGAMIYIMTIHFAFATKGQFNLFLIMGVFIFGGILGYFLQSYTTGFVISIILSLFLW